ncbi:amidohydrolase family protein [Chitinophaga rhizophila]|uniref:Amidohydrolase family protein n=1 Tax=Chitinophaga rhizophila TaxID=2866212 RepID=A0ABS7GDQ8_9BACT|nr:amidohydrolase family protein [Chitinophaga rhizophila]MBW8685809.1 amidohydrolase family protein [Chitinophaga rhizophila]
MSEQLKFKGTALFTGRQLLPGSMVLILSDKGVVLDIVHESQAGEDVRILNGLLSPGFVNTHCHLELSHMAGVIPEGTGLPAFLTSVMEKRGQQDAAVQEKAMQQAAQAMWESGVAAVGDICNSTATLSLKKDSPVYYHSFIETMGFVPGFAQQRYDYSLGVLEQFRTIDGPRHTSSIVPHAPYSVSEALFALLATTPNNTPITIHNQECEAENMLYKDKSGAFLDFYRHFNMDATAFQPTGANSLPAWLPWFKHLPVILVHNTYTTAADIAFTREHAPEAYWCLCPQANLYIEKRIPDVPLLRSQGCTITLGTDSLASNHNLSIWQEIQVIRQHYSTIALEEILQWATLNGAMALGIADKYGSFETGRQPGVLLIDELESHRIL